MSLRTELRIESPVAVRLKDDAEPGSVVMTEHFDGYPTYPQIKKHLDSLHEIARGSPFGMRWRLVIEVFLADD